ncbi:MAG: DUF4832 domain-containing protein [Kiritimatiellae bacterium]|nr:DUF4832 domain-containing protein [Kiritimatiellia bacterium]
MSKKLETISDWRKAYGVDEVVQRVRPYETDRLFRNPHKGTTTFQRFNGDPLYPDVQWSDRHGPLKFPAPKNSDLHNDRYPDTAIAYCRWVWSDLEQACGEYRWDIVEKAFATGAKRGQTVQVRIQPYVKKALPEWLLQLGARTVIDKDGNVGLDANCPIYKKHFKAMLRSFAKKFDGHPSLESFDVAYGGPFGETGGNATKATAEELVDVYFKSFKKTQLLVMLGSKGSYYAPKAYPNRKIGWRIDCIGDLRNEEHPGIPWNARWNHMYDQYPKSLATTGLHDAWKVAPVTMETCWTVSGWERLGFDVDYIIEEMYRYHTSVFMPKSCYVPEKWRLKFDELNRKLGYRFVIRQMKFPLESTVQKKIDIECSLDNVGVAPLYNSYDFALRFRQNKLDEIVRLSVDPRTWGPGKHWFGKKVSLPKNLKPGVVEIECSLVDQNQKASISFANEKTRDDHWLPLTKMDILFS